MIPAAAKRNLVRAKMLAYSHHDEHHTAMFEGMLRNYSRPWRNNYRASRNLPFNDSLAILQPEYAALMYGGAR